MSNKITAIPFSNNYNNVISKDSYQGKLKFTNGFSTGYDVKVGYYFNSKRTFGVEGGFSYYAQQSNLGMDSFHVEFEAKDVRSNVYRQVISTDHKITETVKLQSMNIPLELTYKYVYTEDLFFTTNYKTDANFDYEAIYMFEGTNTPVYDNSPVPNSTDYLITKSYAVAHKYDAASWIQTKHDSGLYNVGLNEKVNKNSGSVKYQTGTLGYTAEIAANYRLMKNVYARGGIYYTAQSFKNSSANSSSRLTDTKITSAPGQDLGVNYNSLLNEVQKVSSSNYGITIGIRVYINKTAWKYQENDMDRITKAAGKPE